MSKNNKLTAKQKVELLLTLKQRFEKNSNRHKDITWEKVAAKLEKVPDKLWSLYQMEQTDGEPDVVDYDKKSDEYIFFDCSAESPKGRRSLCFDQAGLDSRKEHKPKNSAEKMAQEMGVELFTEQQYRQLQKLGKFDCKTSSWIATPAEIRELGGALFCERRYEQIFVFHNSAPSYYSSRGFRASLKV